MYEPGYGVLQYSAEAVNWYRKAAEQGDAGAQDMLGSMYTAGRGVPQDPAEAVSWYRKAAEQGDAEAQFNLGVMYANGKGVLRDYVQAHKWFNLSAARGSADAEKNRDIVERSMTSAQLAEAQSLASEWKPQPIRYCQGPGHAADLCRVGEVAPQSGRQK